MRRLLPSISLALVLVWGCSGGSLNYNELNPTPIAVEPTGDVVCGVPTSVGVTGGVPPYRYQIDDESIAEINSNGELVGKKVGSVQILVSDYMDEAPIPISRSVIVALAPDDPKVARGATLQISAQGCSTTHTFSVLSGTAGTISSSGLFTALLPGNVVIEASDASGNSGSTEITVPFPSLDLSFAPSTAGVMEIPNTNSQPPVIVKTSDTQFVLMGGNRDGNIGLRFDVDGNELLRQFYTPSLALDDASVTSGLLLEPGKVFGSGWMTTTAGPETFWVLSLVNSDTGQKDSSFNGGQNVAHQTAASVPTIWPSAARLTNGKILVTGFANTDYNATIFNADGSVLSPIHSIPIIGTLVNAPDSPPAIATDSTGQVWVSIPRNIGPDDEFGLLRYSSLGVYDAGVDIVNAGQDMPLAMVFDSEDQPVIAGFTSLSGGLGRIAKVDQLTGTIVFERDVAKLQPGHNERLNVALKGIDGRLFFVGSSLGGANPGIIIVEWDSILNTTPTGAVYHFATNSIGAIVDPSGRILVAGTNGTSWILARFWP